MTGKVEFAYFALWFAHPILQLVVAGAMIWRKLHKKFPVFFIYIISQVVTFGVVFSCYKWGYAQYFYAYWTAAAISLSLCFKVIHEIFLDVFRPYHTLKDLGTMLFKWAGLVMVLVACVVAASSPVSSQGPLVQAVLTVQRCVRVIQVGLILFLLVFSNYLGVSWRHHTFGIALGFGGFASVELLVVALSSSEHLGMIASGLVNMAAYNAGILIWLAYIVLKKRERQPQATLLMSQRWEQSLSDIQYPVPADSLIPMFQNIVDRALSRNPGDDLFSSSESSTPEPSDTKRR